MITTRAPDGANKNDKIVCPAHILLPNAILSELYQLYRVYTQGGSWLRNLRKSGEAQIEKRDAGSSANDMMTWWLQSNWLN